MDFYIYSGVIINIAYEVVSIVQGNMVSVFDMCIFAQKMVLYSTTPINLYAKMKTSNSYYILTF